MSGNMSGARRALIQFAVIAVVGVGTSMVAHAAVIYNADFEAQTVGMALPTGLPPGLPSQIDPNLTATVENAVSISPQAALPTRFARLSESAGEAPDLQFDSGVSFTSGTVTVSMDLLFESLESYHVYFREGSGVGGAAVNMADIVTQSDGTVRFESNGGVVANATYAIDTAIHLEAIFNLDANTWDAMWDGVLVVDDAPIFDDALGLVIIGFEFSGFDAGPNQDGVMQFDNYRFETTEVAEPSMLGILGLGLVGLGLARRRKVA